MKPNRSPALAHIAVPVLYVWRGRPYANVNQLARLLARNVLSEPERAEVEAIILKCSDKEDSR